MFISGNKIEKMSIDFKKIRDLFDIKDDLFGFPKIEIKKAEARLGIDLPQILRKYYQELGNHQKLNQAQNSLLSLEKINLDKDGFLVFYVENQYVAIWGIHKDELKEVNPKVYRKVDNDKWELENKKLSSFLNSMAFMQAIYSFNYHANICGVDDKYDNIVTDNYRELEETFPLWNVKFYRNQAHELIMVFRNKKQTDMFVAAKNKKEFDAIINKFDFEWDYHSERDE